MHGKKYDEGLRGPSPLTLKPIRRHVRVPDQNIRLDDLLEKI